jgi:hypothetical protein
LRPLVMLGIKILSGFWVIALREATGDSLC